MFTLIKKALDRIICKCAVNRTRLGGYIARIEPIYFDGFFMGVEIDLTSRTGQYALPRLLVKGQLGKEVVERLGLHDYVEVWGNIAVRASECDDIDGYPMPFVNGYQVIWSHCEIAHDLDKGQMAKSHGLLH